MSDSPVELRDDLLEGRRILIAGPKPGLSGLGALVERLEDPGALDDQTAAREVADFASRAGGLEAVVVDTAALYAAGGPDGMAAALDVSWTLARAAATAGLIDSGGGTIVLVAPGSGGDDAAANAVADGLENMARALSVEWARFDVRVVAICPRPGARQEDVEQLVAWLCSASGTYASGCRLEPGG